MRIFRYVKEGNASQLAAVTEDNRIYDLPQTDFQELIRQSKEEGMLPIEWLDRYIGQTEPSAFSIEQLKLIVPVEAPEVWAAGVTYERSRDARNYEATAGKLDAATFYDKVYVAERPELFMKSTAARTVGPEDEMCLRSDSNWQIPEPELGLVLMKDGTIAGFTIGNDLSCRDIEGENPLYLPQAKVWKRSCSIGPAIRLAETVANPYDLTITGRIFRSGQLIVEGTASTGQLKRSLDELVSYLIRDNEAYDGMVLLTGTCIVPPNEFTLQEGDVVEIEITGIGILRNRMVQL